MKGLIIDTGKEPVIATLPDMLEPLQNLCGGYLSMMRFPTDSAALLYVSTVQLPPVPNRLYREKWYYGRLLIVGLRNNRFIGLTTEQLEQYRTQFRHTSVPEKAKGAY
ncbi:MAG: hypothetical protein RSF73_04965 [Ruthenibacterium sp.]